MNIKMYGKKICPFCTRAKTLLNQKGLEYSYEEIDNWDENQRSWLRDTYKMKTVPIIIIDDKLVGGYEDLVKYFEPPA